ncbi:MAG TPA: hypothetical protein VKA95_10840, partial [Nitrososphaeraceae archaeon]|nr:hypothetical protein [Nitrososphaeraceae archaeon]
MTRRVSIRSAVTLLAIILCFAITNIIITSSVYAQQPQYSFVTKWGSNGISFGEFSQPIEIAIDSAGNVYVTDFTSASNKVQKFASNGTFITSWG